ncbi:hypothetical protein SDC9_95917 [bioreactor metagenome]|uniref:Uncharacterized protein n=1 Tax=bioreactor metagenome TaxID=1076179 RepID=A0A645A7N2_9ZZZZ
MVVCFGLSWPAAVLNSWKARTAKGKSVVFVCFVLLGYTLAITGKILTHNITYVFFFYIINWIMVLCELLLYFRNRKLDQLAEQKVP